MKKIMTWILCLALALGTTGACGETTDSFFEQFDGMEWSFSSGVGAWSTDLRILPDGTFSGEFHDSEMGDSAEAYPNGTVYICSFMGKLGAAEQLSENTWKIRVESLKTDGTPGEERIEEDIRFVTSEPYGLSTGDEMVLYLPGTPLDTLTEDMLFWAHTWWNPEWDMDTLENWFLYSEKNSSGFVGYPAAEESTLANPWEEISADQLMEVSGLAFGVPENAENVLLRYMKSEGLAEMQFTLDEDEYCARIQPAELQDGELMNISGMYFAWENEEPVDIQGCYGTLGQAQTGSEEFVELCMWYDNNAQRMYSLSVYTTELDGLDLTAVAMQCMP